MKNNAGLAFMAGVLSGVVTAVLAGVFIFSAGLDAARRLSESYSEDYDGYDSSSDADNDAVYEERSPAPIYPVSDQPDDDESAMEQPYWREVDSSDEEDNLMDFDMEVADELESSLRHRR